MANSEITVGTMRVLTERAGTATELSRFLTDFEAAYLALYRLESAWTGPWRGPRRRMMFEYAIEFGLPPLLGWPGTGATAESVMPEHQLLIKRVRIESPGFWEFLGSLNPLQQIREYPNDRHKRRQDVEFREAAEREKLILENQIIQRQVWEKENSVLRERIAVLRELGLSNDEIRQLVWASVGKPLAELGKHQDSRLIEGAAD